ncbi:MAG: XdhC family protein [Thermoanaerobaculia bacterium]|nr:XdhC family protein [Thermoanaerobaculia bacterium]
MNAASRTFWNRLAAVLREGQNVLLAVVAESSVHSPGTAGAKMFVASGGERRGTIGGGVMELRVLERAKELLSAESASAGWAQCAELVHRGRLEDDKLPPTAERSGMICAGRQTNLYTLLRPQPDLATVQDVVARLERGAGHWRVDSFGSFRVEESTPLQARSLEWTDDSWRYTESLLERRRLAILGGGHCGQALAHLMSGVDWHVSVWETRQRVLDDADLEDVAEVHPIDDFRDAAAEIVHPRWTPVVVMTTDVPNDVRALYGCLGSDRDFPFVGAMGSAAKIREIHKRLTDLGVPGDALARMTAPVGLEIDSHTPPEIAISVAAQLLERRHLWLGRVNTGEPDSSMLGAWS